MKSIPIAILLLCVGLVPATARAQATPYTASLLGGFGGSFDAEPDPGFGNPTLQLSFAYETFRRALVGFRLGRADFGSGALQDLTGTELTYLTAAGEYRFRETFYESGVFLGLGVYSLDGTDGVGESRDETAVGLVLGLTGDFEINRRFSILVELAGHFTGLDGASTFGTGLAGLSYHF